MAGAALSAEEREEIRVGCAGGESFALMARTLGRSTSTVSEEVRRNGGRHGYCAVAPEKRAAKQRCRPKSTKFQSNRALADHVEEKLTALDSPTTIAIELARAGGISGDTVSAESIYQAVYGHCCIELFERIPEELRRTLTWDQGTEMARHPDLADAVGIDVFFAEPHSPWMRPTNENFNGLLRRYVSTVT